MGQFHLNTQEERHHTQAPRAGETLLTTPTRVGGLNPDFSPRARKGGQAQRGSRGGCWFTRSIEDWERSAVPQTAFPFNYTAPSR